MGKVLTELEEQEAPERSRLEKVHLANPETKDHISLSICFTVNGMFLTH
jgi:hypothetical protein